MTDAKKLFEALDRGIEQYGSDAVIYTDPETGRRNMTRFEVMCDFCNQRNNPQWTYPCGRVEIEANPLMNVSESAWAACDECHALIEVEDWDGLIDRSLRAQLTAIALLPEDLPESSRSSVRNSMRGHFLRFQQARTGPAVKEDDGPEDA